MRGLRLSDGSFKLRTKYGIRELVDCLVPQISELYCVAHGDFLMYVSSEGRTLSDEECRRLDQEYERFLITRQDRKGTGIRDLTLFAPGFLERFRDYLYGDWTNFYLFATQVALAVVEPSTNTVPAECEIFLSCVDAAYWEVFANDQSFLARIQDRYPNAVSCKLSDKTS